MTKRKKKKNGSFFSSKMVKKKKESGQKERLEPLLSKEGGEGVKLVQI